MTSTASPANKKLWWVLPIWALLAVTGMFVDNKVAGTAPEVSDLGWLLVQAGLLGTGVLILTNRPRHRVGRLLFIAGVSFGSVWAVGLAFDALAPAGNVSLWLTLLMPLATMWGPLLAAALFLFPTGKIPSSRWRYVTWVFWLAFSLSIAAPLINGGWGGDTSEGDFSPWHDTFAPIGDILSQAFFLTFAASILIAVAGTIARFVGADGDERLQMKWLVLTGSLTAGWVSIDVVLFDATASNGLRALLTALLIVIMLGSIGVAIIKYRLYDIDQIISRTVSYVLVAGFLLLLFFGLVAVVTSFLPAQSSLSVAVSTLAVAALFNPVRARVQRWVDRRFNRAKYDAQQVVDDYTAGLQDETNLDELADGLAGVVQQTLQPTSTGLWVREP